MFAKLFKGSSTSEIEERLGRLEREFKNLELEWENAYDKLHSMMGRIARRAAKMHEAAEDTGNLYPDALPEPDLPSDESVLRNSGHFLMTPRQRTIQRQIMARRAANGGRP